MENTPKLSPSWLLAELKQRVVVCDGGMGTQLMARGMQPGECPELWNRTQPDHVRAIHAAYRDAGCQLLTTNTFGGTSTTLGKHGHGDDVEELNTAGARLAREAAGGKCLVMGDVGPFGDFLEPVGDTTLDQLREIFCRQLNALATGGADGIIIETMSDATELSVAVAAAKAVSTWPVIATFAYAHGEAGTFRTMMGTSAEDATKAAIDAGADIVGSNCGTSLSLDDYVRLADAIVSAAGSTPVILQPNAGAPQMIAGKLTYLAKPQDMAHLATRLINAGVKVVGGCCGTTPDHLRAMAAARSTRR